MVDWQLVALIGWGAFFLVLGLFLWTNRRGHR